MNTATHIVSGNNPKLLILSGMHGDEYEVIDCVKSYVAEHPDVPSYEYIAEVSPSAVAQRTRRNAYNHDMNRSFIDPPIDPEVKAFIEQVSNKHFTLCLNFHEDPDLAQTFYMYDSGVCTEEQLLRIRSQIIEAGAGLHSGADDPLDADLGYHVEKGYISTPYSMFPQDSGFSGGWLFRHGIIQREIVIEIPGKAPRELKQTLVNIIFTFFLTPEFGF